MRRPLELYPEDGELHRQESRGRRRANHRARAAAAPTEDTSVGTTAREFNLRESRENYLTEFRESTASLDLPVSPDTAITSSSTQVVATATDTSVTSSGGSSLRAPGSRTTIRDRPEVAAQRAIEAPRRSANDRVPVIRPPTVLAVPRPPSRANREEVPSLRMADGPTSIYMNNEEFQPVRRLIGATPLSRSNQISLTSALIADTPSRPLVPASPTESSTSSAEDELRIIRPTAIAFSQADFDSWYNSQNEATRALVSYADYQYYALHGSRPPYGAFPERSADHIRHNSILRVQILILPVTNLGDFDLDPLQCQTMQGFVRMLQTAARHRGLWIHPDTGQEEEGELPFLLQGGVIYLDHHAVVWSRRFDEANQLVVEIEDQTNILYDFWWKLNFEYGRRDVVLGRVEVGTGVSQ